MTTQFHNSQNPRLPTPEEYSRRLDSLPERPSKRISGAMVGMMLGAAIWITALVIWPGFALAALCIGGPVLLLGYWNKTL